MEERIAFVFDTNFILQNKKLDKVLSQLDEKYVPYVTQVSIEERKAQQCSDKKKAYERVREEKDQISSLVSLKDLDALEVELTSFRTKVQQLYEKQFDGTVIKYDISSDIFNSILQRAFEKIPPFNDSDNASDKGFKDTLLWLSIMEYFKSNGENEIVFLTDDKGFANKMDALTKEFNEYTGKTIRIMKNQMFNSLLAEPQSSATTSKKDIPNIESIRAHLQDLLFNICWVTELNLYYEEETYRSFFTNTLFDDDYIKSVMDDLDEIIQENLFSDRISAASFLDKDGRIYEDQKIDMALIEALNKLYKEVSENYPDRIDAFIKTIKEKLNENYKEPEILDDSGVPF